MALPLDAVAWADALDPHEFKEYVAQWGTVNAANGGATIASATVALSAEAVTAGVVIDDAAHPPASNDDDVTIWLRVEPENRLDAAFDGEGATFGVEITIDDSDGRTLQRTWQLTVRQR
ncbi:hypothetical protein [Oceanibacterium hippocampi]|uniref:Uncharacterized protein n=1 Tax=Oceanibacterium hippocampi TaxID=745714 RepID=A0A1Y5S3D8_9PROT|nr:hypothetical protein [Oceanibacterium hippocampi]SLN31779.1 hypothetical protein OCH7691_01154 [Oceanibacterium hippocampi]